MPKAVFLVEMAIGCCPACPKSAKHPFAGQAWGCFCKKMAAEPLPARDQRQLLPFLPGDK